HHLGEVEDPHPLQRHRQRGAHARPPRTGAVRLSRYAAPIASSTASGRPPSRRWRWTSRPAASWNSRKPSWRGRRYAPSTASSVSRKNPLAAALTASSVQADRCPGWPPPSKYNVRWTLGSATTAAYRAASSTA